MTSIYKLWVCCLLLFFSHTLFASPALKINFNGNIIDVSGNNNQPILYGAPVWTTDRNGTPNSALLFDGATNYIIIPHTNSLMPQDQLTLMVWVRVNKRDKKWMPLIYKGSYTNANSRQFSLWAGDNSAAYPETFLFHSAAGGNKNIDSQLSSLPVVKYSEWNHIAVVINRRINKTTFYINGNELPSLTDSNTYFNQTTDSIYIGYDLEMPHRTDDQLFSGALDELEIHTTALTTQDIQKIYRDSLSLQGKTSALNKEKVVCRNITTGQTVTANLKYNEQANWNCMLSGLITNKNDKISITISGAIQ